MTEEIPPDPKAYVILRRHYRTLPSSEYHITDPDAQRRTVCGIMPGVAYVFVDNVPKDLRLCGECNAIAERRKRP